MIYSHFQRNQFVLGIRREYKRQVGHGSLQNEPAAWKMRNILLPLLLFFQAVQAEDMSHRLERSKDCKRSFGQQVGGERLDRERWRASWKAGGGEKLLERKAFQLDAES